MNVGQLLRRKPQSDVVTVETSTNVAGAAHLLIQHGVGCLPAVGSDAKVVGLVSERDVVRAVERSPEQMRVLTVGEIMRSPAPSCSTEDSIYSVMGRMTRERHRHLVVLDGEELAGVISVGDLVKNRMEELEMEAGVLRDHVIALRAKG